LLVAGAFVCVGLVLVLVHGLVLFFLLPILPVHLLLALLALLLALFRLLAVAAAVAATVALIFVALLIERARRACRAPSSAAGEHRHTVAAHGELKRCPTRERSHARALRKGAHRLQY
jgi:hypothetical protein